MKTLSTVVGVDQVTSTPRRVVECDTTSGADSGDSPLGPKPLLKLSVSIKRVEAWEQN